MEKSSGSHEPTSGDWENRRGSMAAAYSDEPS